MRKVLIVITTSFVFYGGLTSVMMNLYKNIDKNKYIIDFASTNKLLSENLRQILKQNHSNYYYLGNRKKNIISYCYRLNKLLRINGYDVIHINSNSATASIELAIAKFNNISKRIVHNHSSSCDHKMINRLLLPFFNMLYTKAIACSEKAGNWLFPNNCFFVINNGIDTEKYRFSNKNRTEIRKRFNINDSAIVLGHVGKFYKPKNHLFLVRLFFKYHQINRNSFLLLVGDGILRHEIENEIKQLGIAESVIFAGMQNNPEIFLSAMDCFVFPSIWEGMPLSLIEAQANGLPCLASSNIDLGAKLTTNIIMLPIDRGINIWFEHLLSYKKEDRFVSSDRNIQKINSAGFNAAENAKIMEDIYS